MMPSNPEEPAQSSKEATPKSTVVAALENESKEGFKAKKAIAHPLPKAVAKKLFGFLDKYGEDYEVMEPLKLRICEF